MADAAAEARQKLEAGEIDDRWSDRQGDCVT